MAVVTMCELLVAASHGKYAVGAFNITSLIQL